MASKKKNVDLSYNAAAKIFQAARQAGITEEKTPRKKEERVVRALQLQKELSKTAIGNSIKLDPTDVYLLHRWYVVKEIRGSKNYRQLLDREDKLDDGDKLALKTARQLVNLDGHWLAAGQAMEAAVKYDGLREYFGWRTQEPDSWFISRTDYEGKKLVRLESSLALFTSQAEPDLPEHLPFGLSREGTSTANLKKVIQPLESANTSTASDLVQKAVMIVLATKGKFYTPARCILLGNVILSTWYFLFPGIELPKPMFVAESFIKKLEAEQQAREEQKRFGPVRFYLAAFTGQDEPALPKGNLPFWIQRSDRNTLNLKRTIDQLAELDLSKVDPEAQAAFRLILETRGRFYSPARSLVLGNLTAALKVHFPGQQFPEVSFCTESYINKLSVQQKEWEDKQEMIRLRKEAGAEKMKKASKGMVFDSVSPTTSKTQQVADAAIRRKLRDHKAKKPKPRRQKVRKTYAEMIQNS